MATLILKPNDGQQTFALRQPYSIFEILYGGARGGGKTYAGMMWLAEPNYINNPRYQGLVVRLNSVDLADWIERARFIYGAMGATISGNPPVIRFPSGAIIRTGHLKDDNAFSKYQGHEYHKELLEELTQIPSEERYLQLLSSCRSTIPELKPQVFASANPGGPGHLWVKERFIDPAPPNTPFVGDDGVNRIFIPATMDDNPTLMSADPDYMQRMESLKDVNPDLYRAWRFGDWNIFVGQVFREWQPYKNGQEYHVISKLPEGKKTLEMAEIYVGFDWGFNDPASAHWIAVMPENDLGVRHVYVYREIYERERTAEWWADTIADIIKDEPVRYVVLPHDAFSRLGGSQTIASRFEARNIPIANAEAKSHAAKINRQSLLHDVLSESPDGTPYLQVLEHCRNLIRTIPALPYSESKPEEIDDKAEDHPYDSTTYGLYFITHGEGSWITPRLNTPKLPKSPYTGQPDGTISFDGIDVGKILSENENQGRDWRSL